MRKRPVNPAMIDGFKGAVPYIERELDQERRELAQWEQDKIQMALWGMRPLPAFFDKAVTRRHQGEIRLRERVLKKLNKVLRCGAVTRRGTPCQCKPEPGKKRCKLHGGKSTGPKTEAGREAIRESNRRRAEARRQRAPATH